MHVEYLRMKSFSNWPTTTNPDATPSILSKYGFYFAPSPHQTPVNGKLQILGADTCQHFNSNFQLSNWDTLEHPSKELHRGVPDDPFTQGKPTGNVTLAYTLSVLPPQTQANDLVRPVLSFPFLSFSFPSHRTNFDPMNFRSVVGHWQRQLGATY